MRRDKDAWLGGPRHQQTIQRQTIQKVIMIVSTRFNLNNLCLLFGLILCFNMALLYPGAALAHIVPGDGQGHDFEHYTSDPAQPLYAKMAECAAIYKTTARYAIDAAFNADEKQTFTAHADAFKNKALHIATKMDVSDPEQQITTRYNHVYKIWRGRWDFKSEQDNHGLIWDNRAWINYCKKTGRSYNVFID